MPLALIILTLIWGVTWPIMKQALSYAPPFAFAAERCVGGALTLLLAVKLSGRSFKISHPRALLPIGLTQVGAFMAFQTWTLVETGAGKTAVLIFTMPIWTLLIAWPVLGERIRGKQWVAAISTLVGLVLIIEPWQLRATLFSEFLGITAAVCWACGTILVKRLRAQHPVDLLTLTAWQLLIGAAPLCLLALVVPEGHTDWSSGYLGILLFVSIVSTGFCWWLWILILDSVPAWEAGLSVLGVPVVALVSSRFMMEEAFSLTEMAGILLISGGLALLSFIGWAANREVKLRQGQL
jgi:drug/metabolite transporter (DMT)-like permease